MNTFQTHILGDQWSNHVTPNNRKAVKAMIEAGITHGKIGRAVIVLMKGSTDYLEYRITRNEVVTIGADKKPVHTYIRVTR